MVNGTIYVGVYFSIICWGIIIIAIICRLFAKYIDYRVEKKTQKYKRELEICERHNMELAEELANYDVKYILNS